MIGCCGIRRNLLRGELLALASLASLLTLRRRQTHVATEELAPPGPGFDPVRHGLAQLPHAEVQKLGDREGTDDHLGGNASPEWGGVSGGYAIT